MLTKRMHASCRQRSDEYDQMENPRSYFFDIDSTFLK